MYIQDYQLSPVPLPGFCFPLGVHVLEGCGEQSRRISNQVTNHIQVTNDIHCSPLFSGCGYIQLNLKKMEKLKLKKMLKLKRVA